MSLGRIQRRGAKGPNGFVHYAVEHLPLVYNFLLRQLGSAADAEDATVEVFRRAHRSRHTFRGDCSERTWLMRIAVNVAIRAKEQKAKRKEVAFDDLGREEDWAPNSNGHAEGGVLDRYVVDEALKGLPDAQRAALWLRVGLEYTDEETAEILKVPVGTVKSWVWRSLARLRKWAREEEAREKETLSE